MRKKIIIDGKETRYFVSDDGKVYNDKTGRELKGTYTTNEYHSIQLRIDNKSRTFMVHRLVAEAFCENPNGYTIVDHIDRDKHSLSSYRFNDIHLFLSLIHDKFLISKI